MVAPGRLNGSRNVPRRWARVELSHPNVLGLPNAGGFDRILVSADGGRVPEELVAQLRPGGRLVTPASCEMWVVDKDLDGNVHRRTTGDRFRFVSRQRLD